MEIQNGNKLIINTLSATTYENLPGAQVEIEVTTIVHQTPKEIITVITRPLPTPTAPPVVYTQKTKVVVPPPIEVIKYVNAIDPEEMVKRLCSVMDWRYIGEKNGWSCRKCVLTYYETHPNASKGDFMASKTGCNPNNGFRPVPPPEPKPAPYSGPGMQVYLR